MEPFANHRSFFLPGENAHSTCESAHHTLFIGVRCTLAVKKWVNSRFFPSPVDCENSAFLNRGSSNGNGYGYGRLNLESLNGSGNGRLKVKGQNGNRNGGKSREGKGKGKGECKNSKRKGRGKGIPAEERERNNNINSLISGQIRGRPWASARFFAS